ncbi:hypothetical protein IJ843_08395 [bacterium]|nr:hypothetical protein [bacterium]
MLNISQVNSINNGYIPVKRNTEAQKNTNIQDYTANNQDLKTIDAENLKAYHPSFTAFWNSNKKDVQTDSSLQFDIIKSKLDKKSAKQLENLQQKGILLNNTSNDGSTVLDNLYKIISEPRIQGLDEKIILTEVINALDNPYSITQKFGDIPDNVAEEISRETGEKVPETAKNVVSSSCVAASMEFNLADRCPAEFARFAAGLSSENYSVDKNIKISDFSENFVEGIWKLREFNTINKVNQNWEDVTVKLHPDRNAIVRARVQTSYKNPGERSCIDVLIQSAILNFASQNSYNAITDERTGKFNPDKTGLTDFEKNFAEQVIFETPKYSVVYQDLDENGFLKGYNSTLEGTKQHILKSLQLGQNVIIGYTHMNADKQVDGGHEITIIGYEKDKNGKGSFICNDTDDDIDEPVKISEEKLLPLIHHAGITKEALNPEDTVVNPWREYLADFKQMRLQKTPGVN